MNKDLYNSSKGEIEFPKEKKEHMKKCFHMVKNADENTEGYNRNKELTYGLDISDALYCNIFHIHALSKARKLI